MITVSLVMSRIKELKDILDSYITSIIIQEELPNEIKYALQGGKEIRGTLALFMADTLAGNPSVALPVAFAMELMHSASLIHDDIIDNSELRRGRESFWKRYGLEKAIIFPHIMMATAIKYVAQAGIKAVLESMDAWRNAALGQIWDMEVLKGGKTSASYLDIISKKTGVVFEAASVLPLYALNFEEKAVKEARNYGLSLGRAYQILDDIIDIEMGKKDSGSVVKLLEEAGEASHSYALKLFKNELDTLFRSSMSLSTQLAYYARYSLEVFLSECQDTSRRLFLDLIEARWDYWGLPAYQ